ncbi:hypothetical protein HN682_02365 [Candidatus Peregrinibacteria bacterium]|jgi:hypothetical protein|nr:hypothetical protein [Candidatus Peregrinibacteria bacterium]
MVSVQLVYDTLKDLANKDQKGFITPAVFNNFAAIAQINIYNELFQELVKAKQIQRQNFDPGRDKSVRKQATEDLAPFIISDLEITSGSKDNIFFKPANLSKIISMSFARKGRKDMEYDSSTQRHSRKEIELVYDVEKVDRILTSNLSTPTKDFPIALISDEIEVFPDSISEIRITYYRRPGSINWEGDSIDANPTYQEILGVSFNSFDPIASSNFMLPPHYDTELVMEIAKLIGVRLRDPNVAGFASQEEASE